MFIITSGIKMAESLSNESPGSVLLEMSQVLHDKAKTLKASKSKTDDTAETSEDETAGSVVELARGGVASCVFRSRG